MIWFVIISVSSLFTFGALYDFFTKNRFRGEENPYFNDNVEIAKKSARAYENNNYSGFGH